MMQNQLHANPQPVRFPLCPKHNEPIKGLCFFPSKCDERLLCRNCRKSHDSNHLNHYEELEDLIHGNMLPELKDDFEAIIKVIDNQNFSYENNGRLLTSQIDYLFQEIQTHILQKLTQARDTLRENINRKLQKNNTLKQKLTSSLAEMTSSFQKAIDSNFFPQTTADDMIQAICNAQTLKDNTENDPELQGQPAIDFNLTHLATVISGNLFQGIKFSLDQICQDVENSFVINTAKPSSIGKGQLIPGGTIPPVKDYEIADKRFQDQSEMGQARSSPFSKTGFANRRHERVSPHTKTYGEADLKRKSSPSPLQKSATDILKLFEMADQQEARNTPKRPFQGSYGDTEPASEPFRGGPYERRSVEKPYNYPPNTDRQRRRSNERGAYGEEDSRSFRGNDRGMIRKNEIFELRDKATTTHEHILFGGLAYIEVKEQLAIAGTEGRISILNTSTMEEISSFEAHENGISKLLFIAEKSLLLSADLSGTISVWDPRQRWKKINSFKKHEKAVSALTYLPEHELVVSGGDDEYIRMWNVTTCKESFSMKTENAKVGSICRLGKKKRIAVGFDRGHINIISVANVKRKAYTIRAHEKFVLNLSYVEDKNMLISSSDDGYIKVWNLYETKAEVLGKLSKEKTFINSFIAWPEKDLLVSNHSDKSVVLWKLSTGKRIRSL